MVTIEKDMVIWTGNEFEREFLVDVVLEIRAEDGIYPDAIEVTGIDAATESIFEGTKVVERRGIAVELLPIEAREKIQARIQDEWFEILEAAEARGHCLGDF